ncbi:hypothetical protein CCORG_0355 [Campylobacter corcagiensis]|uniref:Rdx family protein n=1 Tax=Campylobacter corcagiensis TaxID=1448857 RepID=A0A7M1LGW8_9BACT|nr:hypothetical protein CCORG_0355 [Campylobacter corcagiensis]QOQ87571.1 Rdx family protein [Campylobacter corcagiensis]
MKEEIENNFKNAEFELEKGSGGDFIVEVDGKVIFSKNDLPRPRFPEDGEILKLIKN